MYHATWIWNESSAKPTLAAAPANGASAAVRMPRWRKKKSRGTRERTMMRPSCPAYTHEVRIPVHWKARPATKATQGRVPISRDSRYIPQPARKNWKRKMAGRIPCIGSSQSARKRTG